MTRALDDSWPTVAGLMARAARLYADRTAVVDVVSGATVTYAGLAERAGRVGASLRRRVGEGAVVAVLADNSADLFDAYLGVPAAQLVLLPLNHRLAADELRFILIDAHVQVVLAGAGYGERAEAATAGLEIDVVALGSETLLAEAPTDVAAPHADEPAYLYYTSGTTGRPKGVVLTHRNVLAGALSGGAATGLSASDTWLHAGPMFHLADAWVVWALTWIGGRHVTLRFEPEVAVEAIVSQRVTRTLLVPTALDMLAAAAAARGERLGGVSVFYGGAAMPPDVYERATAALDAVLVPTYGATETAGLCTALQAPLETVGRDHPARRLSVGIETPLIDITLVAPEDPSRLVGQGEVGEILVRGPNVMTGYLGRPDATAEVLYDGGLRTGDLARRDGDGNLMIVDRLKDMIISGGENVYAQEVERVLASHPAVAAVAVVGRPDKRWGETVCAVVELDQCATVTLDELRDFARADLAGYKLPRLLELVDRLPRTGSGKVDKGALRKTLTSARTTPPGATP